jgi:hypothetical protein
MGYLHLTTKDISPGGSDFPVFQQSMLRAKDNTKDFDANAMCNAAEGMHVWSTRGHPSRARP